MMKRLKLTTLLFVIMISTAVGQSDFRDGFIITPESDTLKGQVHYRSNAKNYQSCIFKNESGTKEYLPDQILGFGYFSDKHFSAQIAEGEFVEVLVQGELTFYKSSENFLMQKGGDIFTLESIKTKVYTDGLERIREEEKWRGVIAYLISDCLSDAPNIVSKLKLSENSLTKVTIRYNTCKVDNYIVYKANKPLTDISFGLSIGMTNSTIRVKDDTGFFPYLGNAYSSIDPTIGVVMTFLAPRFSDRIALEGGLYFLQSSYSALVSIEGSQAAFHDTFIDLTTLSIPISFKYALKEKRYTPYVQAGMTFDHQLNAETRLLSEAISGTVVNTSPEGSAFEVNNNQVGAWGGLGLTRSYKRFSANLSIRYFQVPGLNRTRGFSASTSRISINLILLKR